MGGALACAVADSQTGAQSLDLWEESRSPNSPQNGRQTGRKRQAFDRRAFNMPSLCMYLLTLKFSWDIVTALTSTFTYAVGVNKNSLEKSVRLGCLNGLILYRAVSFIRQVLLPASYCDRLYCYTVVCKQHRSAYTQV